MFARSIVVGAVTAGIVVIAVASGAPAYALSTVNVYTGSAPSGTTVAVQGLSYAQSIALKDLTTNATGSCTSSNLTGTTKAGLNPPSNFAQIDGNAAVMPFNNCSTLGLPFSVYGVGGTRWTMSATDSTRLGVTPIDIAGINVAVSSSSCTFNVSGSVAGTLANGFPTKITIPATSTFRSKLFVSNIKLARGATKCLGGAVTSTFPANQISLSGTWTVSALYSSYNPLSAVAS